MLPSSITIGTLSFMVCLAMAVEAPSSVPGATEIMTWKDGKKSALVLMFDDNLKSQQDIAVPELEKRGWKAVFYVNPNKLGFMKNQFWTQTLPSLGHEYGIHTLNHRGVAATAADDLAECLRILRPLQPTISANALWSFARPGGKGAWEVTRDQERELLSKAGLISRDSGNFLMYVGQDIAFLRKWIDVQIKAGGSSKICFHGVGGDYISITKELYIQLLDHLATKQADLWIAPHMPVHKYASEFSTAKVQTTRSSAEMIEIMLTSDADSALYDQPLTLRTAVPAWTTCVVEQSGVLLTATTENGRVQFDARPGMGTIRLRPVVGK
jgi:peptidoglycan-N-acetylglucosamine deacetylase